VTDEGQRSVRLNSNRSERIAMIESPGRHAFDTISRRIRTTPAVMILLNVLE
jgi:hypothetical protein